MPKTGIVCYTYFWLLQEFATSFLSQFEQNGLLNKSCPWAGFEMLLLKCISLPITKYTLF